MNETSGYNKKIVSRIRQPAYFEKEPFFMSSRKIRLAPFDDNIKIGIKKSTEMNKI